MRKRTFYIPAIDRLGIKVATDAMLKSGYQRPDLAMRRWISRRAVPADAQIMFIELARKKKKRLQIDDFRVRRVDNDQPADNAVA